jgi:hypothetical protein
MKFIMKCLRGLLNLMMSDKDIKEFHNLDKLKPISLRGKSTYHIMYAHDFTWGYLDNVDNEKLSKLCIKNYENRKSEDRRSGRAEDIVIPLNKQIEEIAAQMALAYEQHFRQPISLMEGEGNHWSQVHYKKEQSQFHHHLGNAYGQREKGADVVGVYYVKVPKDSGVLIMKYKKHEFDSSKWYFPPEENKFILFNAGVEHGVSPNENDEPRVIISMNFERKDDKNI